MLALIELDADTLFLDVLFELSRVQHTTINNGRVNTKWAHRPARGTRRNIPQTNEAHSPRARFDTLLHPTRNRSVGNGLVHPDGALQIVDVRELGHSAADEQTNWTGGVAREKSDGQTRPESSGGKRRETPEHRKTGRRLCERPSGTAAESLGDNGKNIKTGDKQRARGDDCKNRIVPRRTATDPRNEISNDKKWPGNESLRSVPPVEYNTTIGRWVEQKPAATYLKTAVCINCGRRQTSRRPLLYSVSKRSARTDKTNPTVQCDQRTSGYVSYSNYHIPYFAHR